MVAFCPIDDGFPSWTGRLAAIAPTTIREKLACSGCDWLLVAGKVVDHRFMTARTHLRSRAALWLGDLAGLSEVGFDRVNHVELSPQCLFRGRPEQGTEQDGGVGWHTEVA
jgi:hypothetical protein